MRARADGRVLTCVCWRARADDVCVCAAYATQWEELLNEQLAVLAQSRDLVAEFRTKLTREEHISRRIHN